MKKIIKVLLLSLVIFTSCSKEDEREIVTFIKDFNVSVEEVTDNSAKLKWTNAVSSDNSKVTYSLIVNNELIKENLETNTYLLTKLKSTTKYNVLIKATNKNKNVKDSKTSFTTNATPIKEVLGEFKLKTENITDTSAKVSWTIPSYKDAKETIEYDFYINDKLYKSNLKETSLVLNELKENSNYNIKVIAKVKNLTKTSISSFKTLVKVVENPKGLELFSKEFTCKSIIVYWTKPTVSDGSKISYSVYKDYVGDDSLIKKIDDEQITEIKIEGDNFSNLTEIIVKATTSNGGETQKKFEINNIPECPKPSDFNIEITNITNKSAIVKWSSSKLSDETEVTYNVDILGGDFMATTSLATNLKVNEFKLDNLKPGIEYRVSVVAVSTEYKTYLSKQEVLTTAKKEIPVHPTIKIASAKLYKSDSKYFSQHLIIKFSEKVKNDSDRLWIKIDALESQIGNYIFIGYDGSNFTGINTGKLSDDNYSKMINDKEKKGYLLITKDSNTYKVNFTYTIE